MKKIEQAQKILSELGVDGWLLYDFHRTNPLAHLFLEIPVKAMATRRFFYWIPKEGDPVQIVHAIEPNVLQKWPGKRRVFYSWQSLQEELKELLKGKKTVAMEYSPDNAIPYLSRVDGGTLDLIRSFGVKVVSSGDFLPQFTAVLDQNQAKSHLRAAQALVEIVEETWDWISSCLKSEKEITEYEVQRKIEDRFEARHLVTEGAPIVAVNAHSADPHYEPDEKNSYSIRRGDLILIDLWAKEAGERTVFGDITRVGIAAERPTEKQRHVFEIVRKAQKAATELVKERFAKKERIEGWEVDEAARRVIRDAGFGEFFIHRTGHNIEVDLHGSGAHMDNLESHDVRPILAGTCFSIEPGIYLPKEFGIRLEYDLYVHPNGQVEISGGEQDAILPLL